MNQYMLALRPKQWIKNCLIFSAPLASGDINQNYGELLVTLISFCSASSIGYIVNDLVDRRADSHHPRKKSRPFASGNLGTSDAIIIQIILSTILVFMLFLMSSITGIVLFYLFLTFTYSYVLKKVAVVEMIVVATCFVTRTIAGGIASDTNLSPWFYIVVIFGAMMVVVGKRLAEKLSDSSTRAVLGEYSESFLRSLLNLCATGAVLGYALWAFTISHNATLAKLSFLPFLICSIRFYWVLERGETELSEDIFILDRVILFVGILLCTNLGFVFFL